MLWEELYLLSGRWKCFLHGWNRLCSLRPVHHWSVRVRLRLSQWADVGREDGRWGLCSREELHGLWSRYVQLSYVFSSASHYLCGKSFVPASLASSQNNMSYPLTLLCLCDIQALLWLPRTGLSRANITLWIYTAANAARTRKCPCLPRAGPIAVPAAGIGLHNMCCCWNITDLLPFFREMVPLVMDNSSIGTKSSKVNLMIQISHPCILTTHCVTFLLYIAASHW